MDSHWICRARDLRPEPTLAEMLADPIVYALMVADHVDPRDLAALIARRARTLQASSGGGHPCRHHYEGV